MATRRKLTLVNGAIDQEGSILTYRAEKRFWSWLWIWLAVCPSPALSPMTMTIGTIMTRLSDLILGSA